MPSSAVRTFTDPDDYAACIRNSTAEMTITGRGVFNAKLTRIDLHRLWMQHFADNLPRVAHTASRSERVSITFRTQPGPTLLWGDAEMLPTNIVRHGEGGSPFQRSTGSVSFAAMSLRVEDAAVVGETLADSDLTRPKQTLIVTPAPSAMARLQRLHATAASLAEDAPEIIAHPEAARSLEQALIQAMADCLATREGRKNTLAQEQHAVVMRRFRRVVEENPEEPLYIPDICRAIRVSPRTLLLCCQEHLGMGPKRYLLLRRMHLVRRALRHATPGTTSVTEIAMRHGFWQLGRFAVKYHSLFGESPSATLHGLSA
jgi:AraC-like DNA-binding protein